MGNTTTETKETNWVFFTHEMEGPKLAWFKTQLDNAQIPFRTSGVGLKGKPIIEIPFENYMDAIWIITQPIGSLSVGDFQIRWTDLPDDHDIFVESVTGSSPPVLTYEDVQLPKVPDTIRMYDCDSSNVSAIGLGPGKDDSVGIFTRFKGGTYYRYGPCKPDWWNMLYSELQLKASGNEQASIGSLLNRILKVPADQGQINCFKLDGDSWVKVLPKGKK